VTVAGGSTLRVDPAATLAGELVPPGDKSVSHRALLVAAICDGESAVSGFGPNADTLATRAAVEALGARVEEVDGDPTRLRVSGCGLRGLREPGHALDVRNAGTLLRLLPGILVGQAGSFTLDGDESIRRRPVDRVAAPLRSMGASLADRDGLPPLRIEAGAPLHAVVYELPVASAQVKSCVLLAGLYTGDGPTVVIDAAGTRDHTERILRAAGARVERRGDRISVWPVRSLRLPRLEVPADMSSAAPFLVAATLLAESHLFVRGVGINTGRAGILTVLERMGGRVAVYNRRTTDGGEPVADLEVRHAELTATDVEASIVPSLIDELPLVALAASMAHGTTRVRGAGELRVKESDRLESVAAALRAVGARVRVRGDGWEIVGVPARLRGGRITAAGDHRIGMLGAIAGLVSREGVTVEGADAIDVSYPGFGAALGGLVAGIQ
jgi:3-phosphoshikimate 1-carboxyvinyltransferase